MTPEQVRAVLARHGFQDGRMISYSKSRYCKRNRGHFVVFNAQVFTSRGRILKQVDLDLTLEGEKLNAAARAAGENFYVLYEHDPTPFYKPGDKPISAILREAVWWTKYRPQDQDRFLPVTSGPLWKKPLAFRCTTGRWRDQPAFSVDLWDNHKSESLRNYSGAAVQLIGSPPRVFRVTKKREIFDAKVSTTRGRPVRPVLYQRTGALDYVWFCHGAAVPAILYDHTVRLVEGLRFAVHGDTSGIHMRREGKVVGLFWPVAISAPEVIRNALAELKRLSAGPLKRTKAD